MACPDTGRTGDRGLSGAFSTLLSGLTRPESGGSFHVHRHPSNHAYYAARDSDGNAVLLIKASGSGRTVPLRLAGLEARFGIKCRVAEPGANVRIETLTALLCLSQDAAIEEYFARVVDLLLDILGSSPNVSALATAIDELVELFQKLRRPPHKSIIGLVGELLVIDCAPDPSVAVSAWRTDTDERYDFAMDNLRVESKASSVRTRVHFLSSEQADPPPNSIGLLASVFVEQTGGGISLQRLLNGIEGRLVSHNLIMRLRSVVADTLGRDLPAALNWSFDLELARSSLAWFDLRSVPAIRGSLPTGVSGVRFASDLVGITPISAKALRLVDATARRMLPF
jgi:hypothetical protein